jgi:hypothetical protein
MKFYIYDVQKGKGYWMPDYKGYTHDPNQAGLYKATELPTHAADCWIAIPQFIRYSDPKGCKGHPNYRVVEDLKRAMDNEL